jgi:hypothetical protein
VEWLKWLSAYLASVRPWAQTKYQQNQINKNNGQTNKNNKQTETTLNFYLIPTGKASIKKTKSNKPWRGCRRKGNPFAPLVRV